MPTLPENRDLLIKEVRYRASYRGTLELDKVCRALLPELDTMADDELLMVRGLLQQGENHLMSWLVEGAAVPEEWQLPVALVRHIFKKNHHV